MKKKVAEYLATRVQDGDVLGLGSGSTVELAIEAIGERIRTEAISVSGVPTSFQTAKVAEAAGITVLSPLADVSFSWAFDGADEVGPNLTMIKGGGGAMLKEKIVAQRAGGLVVIVTEEKIVDTLGGQFAIPVEVIPEAVGYVRSALSDIGARDTKLRDATEKYGPIVTEQNHLIVDAWFEAIEPSLDWKINSITGVVENGLFVSLANEVLVAKSDGIYSIIRSGAKIEEKKLQ